MYKKIEQIYKKESPYNKVKKKIVLAYSITILLLLLLNFAKAYLLMLVPIGLMIFIMKKNFEKELDTKLYFKKFNNDESLEPLEDIIYNEEVKIFKNYLKEEKIYNEKTLNCLTEHYRNIIKSRTINGGIWTILTLIVSVIVAFIDKDGFNFSNFERAIPYLMSFLFITIIIYFCIKEVAKLKTFIKGEDGMLERLEAIFSELYIEYVSEMEIVKLNLTPKKSREISILKQELN